MRRQNERCHFLSAYRIGCFKVYIVLPFVNLPCSTQESLKEFSTPNLKAFLMQNTLLESKLLNLIVLLAFLSLFTLSFCCLVQNKYKSSSNLHLSPQVNPWSHKNSPGQLWALNLELSFNFYWWGDFFVMGFYWSFQRKEKVERTTKFMDDQLEQCKWLPVFLICFVLA